MVLPCLSSEVLTAVNSVRFTCTSRPPGVGYCRSAWSAKFFRTLIACVLYRQVAAVDRSIDDFMRHIDGEMPEALRLAPAALPCPLGVCQR